ncbi:MAG TPA: hypothetical protein VIP11_14805 [Gemmatimonadaceae bacterium]
MTRNYKASHKRRDRQRDNDDLRDLLGPNERDDVHPDTKSEARGDAREAIGNTARDTDTNPTGPEGNDKNKNRPRRDRFDDDLAAS